MFKERLISGIVMVILLIATVGYGGNVLFAVVGIISLIGMSELYKISQVQRRIPGIVGYAAAVGYYALLLFEQREFVTMLAILFLVLLISWVCCRTDYDGVFRFLLCGSHAVLCVSDENAAGGRYHCLADLFKLLGV